MDKFRYAYNFRPIPEPRYSFSGRGQKSILKKNNCLRCCGFGIILSVLFIYPKPKEALLEAIFVDFVRRGFPRCVLCRCPGHGHVGRWRFGAVPPANGSFERMVRGRFEARRECELRDFAAPDHRGRISLLKIWKIESSRSHVQLYRGASGADPRGRFRDDVEQRRLELAVVFPGKCRADVRAEMVAVFGLGAWVLRL